MSAKFHTCRKQISSLVQDYRISIANALEILQSCTTQSIWIPYLLDLQYCHRMYHMNVTSSSASLIYIDGLVQECGISSALATEILQSCTKPSIDIWVSICPVGFQEAMCWKKQQYTYCYQVALALASLRLMSHICFSNLAIIGRWGAQPLSEKTFRLLLIGPWAENISAMENQNSRKHIFEFICILAANLFPPWCINDSEYAFAGKPPTDDTLGSFPVILIDVVAKLGVKYIAQWGTKWPFES